MILIAIGIAVGIYFLEIKYSIGFVPFDINMKNIENYSQLSDFWNLIFGTAVALAGSMVAILLSVSAITVSKRQMLSDQKEIIEKQFNDVYDIFSNLAHCSSKLYLIAEIYSDTVEERNKQNETTFMKLEDSILNEVKSFSEILLSIHKHPLCIEIMAETSKNNDNSQFEKFKKEIMKFGHLDDYNKQVDSINGVKDFMEISLNIETSLLSIDNKESRKMFFKNVKYKKSKVFALIGGLLHKQVIKDRVYLTGIPIFIDIVSNIPSVEDLQKFFKQGYNEGYTKDVSNLKIAISQSLKDKVKEFKEVTNG